MHKRYIIALVQEPVDGSVQQDALVGHSGSPPPAALCQVVLPRFVKHVAEKHPEFEVIWGCSAADFERQKGLVQKVIAARI